MMHETVRSYYPLVSMTDVINRLTYLKQFETEPLLYYVARFKKIATL